jgi:hypothetical protein
VSDESAKPIKTLPALKALVQTDLGKDLVELLRRLLALGREVSNLAAQTSAFEVGIARP